MKSFLCFMSIGSISIALVAQKQVPPKITVVFVVDQLAHYELQKLLPFCTKGLRLLHDKGIQYHNAYQPQSHPVTGPGHAALATGTIGSDHGFISNAWPNPARTKMVLCDDDDSPSSWVFSPHGTYPYGKSPRYLMVDTLSDQLIINSTPRRDYSVCAFSLKSRAAVTMAGRLGKACWFDERSGRFTSSKAYFKELPTWLMKFNQEHNMENILKIYWSLRYERYDPAYQLSLMQNYNYAAKAPMADTDILIDHMNEAPYELFSKTPMAARLLLSSALAYFDASIKDSPATNLVLWIGISNLDAVGHSFGPYSREVLDTIYHLDADLMEFINYIETKVKPREALFALTSDHGVMPIVEQLYDLGMTNALRIDECALVQEVNKVIAKKHGVKKLIVQSSFPNLYFNKPVFNKLREITRNNIIKDVKNVVRAQKGIKEVWTYDELKHMPCLPSDRMVLFKNQLFPERSGDIMVCTFPYVIVTDSSKGTGHGAPYNYDTHVPLCMYRHSWPAKAVWQRVDITQLPVTLSHLLQVPSPSAASGELLPEVPLD